MDIENEPLARHRVADVDERASRELRRLLRIMRALRAPDGCPWDREQTHASLAPHAVEEVYELIEAIDAGDSAGMRDELGDVLLQVVFHAQLAAEGARFDAADVIRGIADKLERRHPHVFGAAEAHDSADVEAIWASVKAAERAGADERPIGAGLPPLARAIKLTRHASRVGFDWVSAAEVIPVLRSEIDEVAAELDAGDVDAAADELGDVLFSAVNLARKLDRDPDALLRAANRKFERRFRALAAMAERKDRDLSSMSLAEMDTLWDAVKAAEG